MKFIDNWQDMVAQARAQRVPVGAGYDAMKRYVLGAALALECQVCHQPMLIETPIYLVHQTCSYGCGAWVWQQGGIWQWSVNGNGQPVSAVQQARLMWSRRAFIEELRQQGNIPFDRC